jgi:glycine/D-amino acid oxidase-like deaminating enzyme
MNQLSDAEIVVIGGGAIGCGVAFALAEAGQTDVLVLERQPALADVTTSQGAGLCGQVRTTPERTKLAMHSARTFARLEQDPQVRPDWHAVGSLRIALSDERVAEFRQFKAACDAAGLEVEWLDAAATAARWPGLETTGIKATLWCPTDGYMRPRSVAASYKHHAGKAGVRFATSVDVERIERSNGRVSGVLTSAGRVECRTVINAAGAHAFHVARLVDLELPIFPVRHEYFVSEPLAGLHAGLPCFRIPDTALYGRAEGGQLLLGGWEPRAMSVDPRTYDLRGRPPAIEPDWPVLHRFRADFARLMPAAAKIGAERVGKGWPTFTPDGRFIIGPTRRVPGFVMAGGCNAHGISGSPGIGRLVVESLLEARPSDYVRSLSPDRFLDTLWDWPEVERLARGVYETYYGLLV